jgi:hypothetical protein
MMLFLKLPMGQIITLDVPATDTIYELKLMIHKNVGIHPSQQYLVYIENLSDLDLIAWTPDALFTSRSLGSKGHLADRLQEEHLVCASEQLLEERLFSDYRIQHGSTPHLLLWTKHKTR